MRYDLSKIRQTECLLFLLRKVERHVLKPSAQGESQGERKRVRERGRGRRRKGWSDKKRE